MRCDDIPGVVHLFASSSDAYMDIRNRFLDVYRRDNLYHPVITLPRAVFNQDLGVAMELV